MTLALVISSLSSGGAERVMCLLANHWAARGEQVCIITLESASLDCYPLDDRVRRIALDTMAESPGIADAVRNNARRIVALRRALRETKAPVVLSFGEEMNVTTLLATRFAGLRVVVSERTDPNLHAIGRVWRLLRRLTYPLAQAVVVQTRGLLPWAQAVAGMHRAHVIPNPVRDMARFATPRVPPPAPVIVAVGRLVPAKGYDVLLKAFAEIAGEFPQAQLVIVGEGPERAALQALAAALGIADRVALPGWSPEPGAVLASATMFALSSHYEGFPNALVEAMACGLPVISAACRGALEIVTDERDGLLAPVSSVPGLAKAMRRLLSDERLRDRLGSNAREVAARYGIEPVIAQWDALLAPGAPELPSAARQ